jgi:hypothetical protein
MTSRNGPGIESHQTSHLGVIGDSDVLEKAVGDYAIIKTHEASGVAAGTDEPGSTAIGDKARVVSDETACFGNHLLVDYPLTTAISNGSI